MRSLAKLLSGLALALSPLLATAQTNLGELLDAGAKRLSPAEFREQIAQRTVVGPAPAVGTIEVMYATNGTIQGVGTVPAMQQLQLSLATIRGEWTIDDRERICTTMQVVSPQFPGVIFPPRCQAWFKLGDDYFLSDSDSDRGTKVLRRTIKPAFIHVAHNNLGELLDAGAKRVSAEEFARDVVLRTLVGPALTGGRWEIVYAADGSLSGRGNLPMMPNFPLRVPIAGKWTIDESARICTTTMRIDQVNLPDRCEFWFKLGETYYVSESAADRRADVFPRAPGP